MDTIDLTNGTLQTMMMALVKRYGQTQLIRALGQVTPDQNIRWQMARTLIEQPTYKLMG